MMSTNHNEGANTPGTNKRTTTSSSPHDELVLVTPGSSQISNRDHSYAQQVSMQKVPLRRRLFSPVPHTSSPPLPSANITVSDSHSSNPLSSSLSSSSSHHRSSRISSPSFESPISSSSGTAAFPIYSLPSLASVSTRSSTSTQNTSSAPSVPSSFTAGSPPALFLPASPMLSHNRTTSTGSPNTTLQHTNNNPSASSDSVNHSDEASSLLSRSPSPSSSSSVPHSPPYHQLFSMRSRSRSRDNDISSFGGGGGGEEGNNSLGSPPISPMVMRRGWNKNITASVNSSSSSSSSSRRNKQKGFLKGRSISPSLFTKKKSSSSSSVDKLVTDGNNKRSSSKYDETVSAESPGKLARKENDGMVYLDGPRIYTCGKCRTHLTSYDEIISKSFHGRHGRAYLFDNCVNVTIGPAEDRRLITGLHSVCDINCKRCKSLIGWTYAKAYEQSQKYKEGKYIIEKINLFMEDSESFGYEVDFPAGERRNDWKTRSKNWGSPQDLESRSAACASALASYDLSSRVEGEMFEPATMDLGYDPIMKYSEECYVDCDAPQGMSNHTTDMIYEYAASSPAESSFMSSFENIDKRTKGGKRYWRPSWGNNDGGNNLSMVPGQPTL